MNQLLATILYVAGIFGLFYLDHDARVRTSMGLWIPVAWLLVIGSRPVSSWLQMSPTVSQAEMYAEGSPVDATAYGLLIVAGVLILCQRSGQVGRIMRDNLPIMLFFLYCALSILWSDYSFIALKRWIKAAGDLVMVLVVLTDSSPMMATRRFFSRAAFVLMPLSVLFIRYYPNLGRSYNRWTWTPMYCGVTLGKNELGMICLVCGLGSLWSFLGAYMDRNMPYRARHLTAHSIIVVMVIWLCVTADSMTSLSCFLMAGTLMLMTTRRYVARRNGIINVLAGGCAALSLFALFLDTGGTLVHSLGRNATLTGRTDIWRAVLSLHTNPLVGTGFETFWMGSRLERVGQMTAPGIQEAHNGYLELYLNLGLVGIALLATLIVSGYRDALASFRRVPHAGRIRLVFITAAAIYSLTEAGFRMLSPIWIALLLAVAGFPLSSRHRKGRAVSELFEIQTLPPTEPKAAAQVLA